MDILTLSWRGPGHPNAGGAEIVTHEYAKGWVKAGHTVTLFTSTYIGAKKEEVIDGVKIIRSGKQIFGVQINAFWWYLFGSHEKFDIVFDHFHGIPFFTPLYVRKRKIAFIHEVAKDVWKLNPWRWPFNLIPAIIGSVLEPGIYFLYKNIPFWTVSNSTKEDLKSFGIAEKNITVLPNGVNTIKVDNIKKEKTPTITFLGALAKDKGIEIALEVFEILDRTGGKYQFWIIGNGGSEYINYLKDKCKKLGIENKVKFWGFVSEKQKFELLARSHVLVNPSSREGWGLVVIEGDSVGTPTVGFNVPGLKDSIIDGETGIICNANTSQNMAQKVISMMEDSKKYDKISEKAKRWAHNFEWDVSIKRSLTLLLQKKI